ncbi:MAG: FAD-dependent oxidoreductase [Pirellula sp.]|nr:FAD-dependent oxidoreductase [Pirellula sp.]
MQIAVIGAGISGLVAAHRLSRSGGGKHHVTLFEANAYPGGHTNTLDVELDGRRHAVDTGFIVFNDRTYPNFIALLDELGIRSRPTEMGFSVRCDRTGLEYNGSSLNGFFARRSNFLRPSFWRMAADIARFNRSAPRELLAGGDLADDSTTVAEYLRRGGYGREFAEHYLLPMGAAIWSCPVGTFAEFPIRFIIDFYQHHGLLSLTDRPQWRVVEGGSRTYVAEILRRFPGHIRLSTPVVQVRRLERGVEITPRGGNSEPFDHVVFACHADQALRMLADPSESESELLSAFPYEPNIALLHTDPALLPRRRRAWASWNYLLSDDAATRPVVTYCMNILQHIDSREVVNVTLNGEHRVDPARVLARITYEHPVFTTARAAAQRRHGELINVRHTSYCGAYWRNGFHEDGVVSALAVCRALGDAAPEERPSIGAEPLRAAASC